MEFLSRTQFAESPNTKDKYKYLIFIVIFFFR